MIEEIKSALPQFEENQKQIQELQKIFKGDQAILYREPTDNQPVNEKVNMNLFPALATSWVGLILGEKTDYVYNGKKEESAKREDMEVILKHIRNNNDILLDKETLYDLFIAGVSYQYSGGQPNSKKPTLQANIPVDSCFVIKSREVGHPVVASAIVGENVDKKKQITIYTNTDKFIIVQSENKDGWTIANNIKHFLPENPIQEIRLNPQYLSMVAQGESAQNALNMAMSESINDTIFQMRSMLLITGAELTEANIEIARKHGILQVNPSDGRSVTADYLTKPLDETITSLRNMLFDTLYFIMGIPSTDGGTSGNTGAAIVASGMQTMDLIAYSIQLEMQKAKSCMLDNLIQVLRTRKLIKTDISAMEIDIAFDRQLVMNIVQAADAFSKLKESGFPNKDNLKVTKLTSDVDRVASEMDKMAKEQEKKVLDAVNKGLNNQGGTTTPNSQNNASNANTDTSNGIENGGATNG